MAAAPQYAATPCTAMCQVTTANTARDGTGTLVDLITAGANGTRVDDIMFSATGNSVAGVITLFIYDGTYTRLILEMATTAITASTTAVAWKQQFTNLGIILKSGWKIKVGITTTQTINCIVTRGGDL
jgi:hypothetical protein